jgi:hypothetical protein
MDVKMLAGKTRGKVFVRKLRRAKLMEFEDDFYVVLEEVQCTTDLISKETCVRD